MGYREAGGAVLDGPVFHLCSLAKNAAACFKKSRSLVIRSSSRLSRMRSSRSALSERTVVPEGAACRCCVIQRYSTFSAIPSSRATCATGRSDFCANRTASALNSWVYLRRLVSDIASSDCTIIHLSEVSWNRGKIRVHSITLRLLGANSLAGKCFSR